jgi:hypothetical protein
MRNETKHQCVARYESFGRRNEAQPPVGREFDFCGVLFAGDAPQLSRLTAFHTAALGASERSSNETGFSGYVHRSFGVGGSRIFVRDKKVGLFLLLGFDLAQGCSSRPLLHHLAVHHIRATVFSSLSLKLQTQNTSVRLRTISQVTGVMFVKDLFVLYFVGFISLVVAQVADGPRVTVTDVSQVTIPTSSLYL